MSKFTPEIKGLKSPYMIDTHQFINYCDQFLIISTKMKVDNSAGFNQLKISKC
jgi:hypothetical protein